MALKAYSMQAARELIIENMLSGTRNVAPL